MAKSNKAKTIVTQTKDSKHIDVSGSTVRDRVNRLVKWLDEGLVERGEVVKLALLALVSGESLFLLGPPGTAKSLISRKVSGLLKDEAGGRIQRFSYLMGRYSTPEELFGPISIKGLKEDRCERKTEGYLPTAHVVFLDEIWKANPAIQNALLTALNEKLYRNGTREEPIPLELCIGASNELPAEGAGLGAIWDRFLIRVWVGNLTADESFTQLMKVSLAAVSAGPSSPSESDALSLSELKEWRAQVSGVELKEEVMSLLLRLRKRVTLYNERLSELNEDGEDGEELEGDELKASAWPLYVSDRRWVKVGHLLQTVAFLSGRHEVLPQDLWVAPYCMWDRPEQRALVSCWVLEELGGARSIQSLDLKALCNELRPIVQQVMNEVESSITDLTVIQQDYLKKAFSKPLRKITERKKKIDTEREQELSGSPFLLGEALEQRKTAYESGLTKLNMLSQDLTRLRDGLALPKAELKELCELLEDMLDDILNDLEISLGAEPRKKKRALQSGDQVTTTIEGVSFYERVIPAPPGGKSFLMMETQVTQKLYEAVMGTNPSQFEGAQKPVEQVSWVDGVKFANALSRKLGLTPAYEGSGNNTRLTEGANGFRLPFEAEWEFAAKGGQSFTYAGSDNLSEVGWCDQNSGCSTHDVAQLKPNGYGLYDMSGNVWEWCVDDYNNPGQYRPGAGERVFRGGGWNFSAYYCTVADRFGNSPVDRRYDLGLRLSRSLDPLDP